MIPKKLKLEIFFGAEIPAGASVELSPGPGLLDGRVLTVAEMAQIQLFRAERVVVKEPRGFRILMMACEPVDRGRHGRKLDAQGRAMQMPEGEGLPDLLLGPTARGNEVCWDTCAPRSIVTTVLNPTAEAMYFGLALSGTCVL